MNGIVFCNSDLDDLLPPLEAVVRAEVLEIDDGGVGNWLPGDRGNNAYAKSSKEITFPNVSK